MSDLTTDGDVQQPENCTKLDLMRKAMNDFIREVTADPFYNISISDTQVSFLSMYSRTIARISCSGSTRKALNLRLTEKTVA